MGFGTRPRQPKGVKPPGLMKQTKVPHVASGMDARKQTKVDTHVGIVRMKPPKTVRAKKERTPRAPKVAPWSNL